MAAVAVPATAATGDALTDLLITEYLEGSSNNKGYELYNGTADSIDLSGYTVEMYSNANTSATSTQALSGTLASGETLVVRHSSEALGLSSLGAITLASGTANFNGNDSIVLKYGTEVVDSMGQIAGNEYWSSAAATMTNMTIHRDADVCEGDADATDTYDLAGWTSSSYDDISGFGAHTTDCTAGTWAHASDGGDQGDGGEEASVTLIHDIQGDSADSPMAGETVTVEAVVVGLYPALDGFFVQEEDADADGDAATSEGVFVYAPGAFDDPSTLTAPELGDLVTVSGTVSEYYEQTQIGSVSEVTVVSSGSTVTPAAVSLPVTSEDYFERYEGMLVEFAQELFVTEYYQQARFGELVLSGSDRLDQPTTVAMPGTAANEVQAANDLNRIKLDDATNTQNDWPIVYGLGGESLTADNSLRGGDSVTGLVGVMNYTYGGSSSSSPNTWRVRAEGSLGASYDFVSNNVRPTEPEDVGGSLTVSGFNVLNYFLTVDNGSDDICGASEDMECRGADSESELSKQRAKLLLALEALDADVISLAELENTPGVDPAADLADGLNDLLGAEVWDSVDTGVLGTDAIRVGMIYNTDAVELAGDFTVMDSTVDEDFDDDRNRPSLAQSFTDLGTGEDFTVVANHLKSKGSCPSDGSADEDQGDGAGCWNATRAAAAQALVDWIEAGEAGNGDQDVLLMGDFNSYAMEDPIQVFVEAGYVNLSEGDYSYVYDGQWGTLDYAFASESMNEQVTGATEFHINADENPALSYNEDYMTEDAIAGLYSEDMYRTSDHDPVLVGLELGDTTTVQVLGTNDFHGRILPTLSNGEAGAAVMAGAVSTLESEYTNSVFTAAGDLVGASTFESFVAKDKPTIDALNLMGLDVSAVGNHEFDQGYDDLVDRIMADYDEVTNPYGGAEWEYLGANVRNSDGSAALPETWMVTFDNGTTDVSDDVTMGFIGVVTEDTPSLVSPSGIAGLTFEDESIAANRSAAVLEEEGVDAIVLLVHEGAPTTAYADAVDTSNNFGDMLSKLDPSIDAVISGHTHLAYSHMVPVQEWIDEGRAVTERPVVSAGQYGMYLDQLIFTFDNEAGEIASIESATVDLAEQVDPECTEDCELVYPADEEVQAIVDAAEEAAEDLGAQTIGTITEPLYRARNEGGSYGGTRGAESTLGNAIADAQLWATEDVGAEIAFMNPGGLRADMLGEAAGTGGYPSTVSYKEANTVQPFGNTLWTETLTGAQIKAVLEEQWQPDGSSRPFLKLGVSEGFEYTYDPDADRGERILQMWLDGEAIDLEAEYTVAMNSFLASGGDNFTTFAEGTDAKDSARVDFDSMVDYLMAGNQIGTDYDQRAIGVSADSLEATAGEEFSFDLSSLMFTAETDLTDANVVVSLDGTVLGTFPVTNTLPTDAYDEHGTASVTVTIPEGLSGEQILTVAGDTTATEFALAVTVADGGELGSGGTSGEAELKEAIAKAVKLRDGSLARFLTTKQRADLKAWIVAARAVRVEGTSEARLEETSQLTEQVQQLKSKAVAKRAAYRELTSTIAAAEKLRDGSLSRFLSVPQQKRLAAAIEDTAAVRSAGVSTTEAANEALAKVLKGFTTKAVAKRAAYRELTSTIASAVKFRTSGLAKNNLTAAQKQKLNLAIEDAEESPRTAWVSTTEEVSDSLATLVERLTAKARSQRDS
ncbi:ExeM/NucH family extracellular endonuclease [Demequina sp. NBRC 110054]|uniref:ExeM/NucH family extracellular endonuclease n=1 Tax=Demequina sp. NBRC 110054 TaxID=1570343 RepID=UPI001356582C|nr:ExeM/NucH family extracellular endonuclease [Demequina sp. NBRC 110054]